VTQFPMQITQVIGKISNIPAKWKWSIHKIPTPITLSAHKSGYPKIPENIKSYTLLTLHFGKLSHTRKMETCTILATDKWGTRDGDVVQTQLVICVGQNEHKTKPDTIPIESIELNRQPKVWVYRCAGNEKRGNGLLFVVPSHRKCWRSSRLVNDDWMFNFLDF